MKYDDEVDLLKICPNITKTFLKYISQSSFYYIREITV